MASFLSLPSSFPFLLPPHLFSPSPSFLSIFLFLFFSFFYSPLFFLSSPLLSSPSPPLLLFSPSFLFPLFFPSSAVLMDLFLNLLKSNVAEISYAAEVAQLE